MHRLREAEVFDLTFLTSNTWLVERETRGQRSRAKQLPVRVDAPFSELTGDRVPGEHIIVERMMYEVIKNLNLDAPIDIDRVILFSEDPNSGYRVRFLRPILSDEGPGTAESFFEKFPGQALAIRYTFDRDSTRPGAMGTERVPSIVMVDCADRAEWGRLLWRMNQPDEDGNATATVLLHSPQDLVRLRRAIVLKRMALLNGGIAEQRLKHFHVGTMLQLPDINPTDIQVIDADVARMFFHTEHYYSATIGSIERTLSALAEAMPNARRLLGGSLDASGVRPSR